MTSTFKEISIRGRLAFAAKCLENALTNFSIENAILNDIVLPRIWSFTNSLDLSEWDDSVKEIDPISIMNTKLTDENFDFSTITFDTFLKLKKVYENISDDIKDIISYTIEIGAGNLYGGTEGYSEVTLKPLMSVIRLCLSLNVILPKIETFKKAKFSEEHGWGSARPKDYYFT